MNIAKNNKAQTVVQTLGGILPILFWMSVIFGFEEESMAIATIIAAIIHECGHVLFLTLSKNKMKIKGVLSGFRIRSNKIMSYGQEALLYLSGPLANITAVSVLLVFAELFDVTDKKAITANLLTAISNLLPIHGYDGYGALRALVGKSECFYIAESILQLISSLFTFAFCMLSLYFIDRYGEGYWIFAVFFISMLRDLSNRLNSVNFEN